MRIHVIYGSDSGRTRSAAAKIAAKVNGKSINVKAATAEDFEADLLVLGVPTYGEGDLQADWEEHFDKLASAGLAGRKVALFGLGDQMTYPESFADAVGQLYDEAVRQGAEVIGFTDTAGYDYTRSGAERDGRFVGLVLDQDNQAGKSEKRIAAWTSQLI